MVNTRSQGVGGVTHPSLQRADDQLLCGAPVADTGCDPHTPDAHPYICASNLDCGPSRRAVPGTGCRGSRGQTVACLVAIDVGAPVGIPFLSSKFDWEPGSMGGTVDHTMRNITWP